MEKLKKSYPIDEEVMIVGDKVFVGKKKMTIEQYTESLEKTSKEKII